jgi:hypothetical protein
MHKPISTRTHGIIDYAYAAAFFALPRLLNWDPDARRVSDAAGMVSSGYSTITDYELGMMRALPMTGHLAVDAVQGATLAAAPLYIRDRNASLVLMGMGIGALIVGMLTQTTPSYNRPLLSAGYA